ncbi:ester cyclase [Janibacter sp. CX7]|jgi:hypothetical protein|uniref:nuclear transport factor 2 family protein n=1 Tax=Janibacter sp. CX7 TaxID=2963431 RepID=UPI0020CD4C5F|nr:nuclear transport factor 2 family protein [Janibacter sp. CX7]UTT64867.1 ester cyclase [Janibacter sp. CX7]
MDATELLRTLCTTIDEHRWEDLPALLAQDFTVHFVHTGETFGRDEWVRLNADYPGFERLTIEDLVGAGDRAVARCHVTGRDESGEQRFVVASFATCAGGLITEMTEVWTDVGVTPPEAARPA